jgi:hypothetical protein
MPTSRALTTPRGLRSTANDPTPTHPKDQAHATAFHEHVPPLQGQRITDQGHRQSIAVGMVHFDGQGRILGGSRNEKEAKQDRSC